MSHPKTFFLVPAKGLIVRDPVTRRPLAEGETKPRSRYWMRRVAEGSCSAVDPKRTAKAPKTDKES